MSHEFLFIVVAVGVCLVGFVEPFCTTKRIVRGVLLAKRVMHGVYYSTDVWAGGITEYTFCELQVDCGGCICTFEVADKSYEEVNVGKEVEVHSYQGVITRHQYYCEVNAL